MSTRCLRRAHGSELLTKNDHDESSDLEPISGDSNAKPFNVFNLLNEDSSVSDERDDNDVNDSTAVKDDQLDNTKRTKKKKKKKKRTDKPLKVCQENRENEHEETEHIDDEIERTVREVNKLLGEPVASCSKSNDSTPVEVTKQNILMVQHKFLNATNELKKICGGKIVSDAEQNKNRNRGRVGNLRKTWLTTSNNWITTGKSGLSMSVDDSIKSDDVQYFVYVHSLAYQQIQKQFFVAVESQNPENIVSILNAHPHHVDALLQFADLCKLNEDLQMSAEFVERAVHCLECAFHPSFNMTTGNCRLNYKRQTNRALFIALFKHLMFIGGRACYRTGLELCKVLLSLDPEGDPLAVVLAIDLYALRAKEYQWFIDFCDYWEDTRNLTQLPNIAYGLALAHYHLGHQEIADEYLQNALIMFPGVLLNLLDKCGVATDTRVMGHDHFNSRAKSTTSPALEKLQNLYVIRTYHLWKEAAAVALLPWIENAAHTVMDRVDAGDEHIKFCQIKRSKRYQGQVPRNILRHIILSDLKEITITLPGMQTEGPIFSYDPLPPADSIDIYVRSGSVQRPAPANSNLFSLFVSSLFMDLDGNPVNGNLNNVNIQDANEPHEFD